MWKIVLEVLSLVSIGSSRELKPVRGLVSNPSLTGLLMNSNAILEQAMLKTFGNGMPIVMPLSKYS